MGGFGAIALPSAKFASCKVVPVNILSSCLPQNLQRASNRYVYAWHLVQGARKVPVHLWFKAPSCAVCKRETSGNGVGFKIHSEVQHQDPKWERSVVTRLHTLYCCRGDRTVQVYQSARNTVWPPGESPLVCWFLLPAAMYHQSPQATIYRRQRLASTMCVCAQQRK